MCVGDLTVDEDGVSRQLVGRKTAWVVMPNWAANETLMSGTCGLQYMRSEGS